MKNKKILFSSIGILVLVLIISIFAFVPINRKFDSYSKNWLSHVDDDTKITEISLPGTHNSGAPHSLADVVGKCQDLSIKAQLDIGVRVFDIRLQLVNDELKVVHDIIDQSLKFSAVLEDFTSFISENPSEFLYVFIKNEGDTVNSKVTFEEVLINIFSPHEDVFKYKENTLPVTLKDARGKIFLLSRFKGTIGVPVYDGWKDDTSFELGNFYIQDNYSVPNVEEKKNDIISAIDYQNDNLNKQVVNFTSCYLNPGFPPKYAGTPAQMINPWFEDLISKTDDKLGIILADFITESLSKVIYMRNIK